MHIGFNEEQEMLRDMVRGVCTEHCPIETVRELEGDPRGYAEGFWKQLAELGLLGITIPEAHGGSGQGPLEAVILYEELGRSLAPSPHLVSCVLSAGILLRAGSEEQQSAWLPRIASGDAILTPVWLEPGRGQGPDGVALRAEPAGDAVRLSGEKWLVGFARSADRLVVLARSGEAPDAIDLYLVDPEAPGVALEQQASLGSETQYRVRFDDVRVPVADRIGAPGAGWSTWFEGLQDAVILTAAQAAGGARRAVELGVEYAKEREQFGKPIGAFQAIAHSLADAATTVEGGTTLVHQAAWARSLGRSVARLAPMAKLFMCETYRDVTARVQQIYGGVGFTIEYDPQLYFRRAKQLQLAWLDGRALEDLIASDVLDDPNRA